MPHEEPGKAQNNGPVVQIRKGQGPPHLSRPEFATRFKARFDDPLFAPEAESLARLEEIAWRAYEEGRKSPLTRPAGPEFADPSYELSVDWLATRQKLRLADEKYRDRSAPTRILMICGAARNDVTCPGEISKSFRLVGMAEEAARKEAPNCEIDRLDLSLLSSEYGRNIHPCKACLSTAMPLCHWPCSCYPNHSLDQTQDWMAEIYERWTLAHAVLIVTPVYWYQAPSGLKLMIDRLVCADGGNPDPTTTHGKKPEEAKALELAGWPYPKHLSGRAYGVVVHGDVAGTEGLRRALSDWLDWMGLVESGTTSRLDRLIGYYEPYATSHDTLDHETGLHEEVRNVARAVVRTAEALRSGRLTPPDRGLKAPRPK